MLDGVCAPGSGLEIELVGVRLVFGPEGDVEHLGIAADFDTVLCRTDGFPVKPDPALFLAAQEALGFPKERCLIVEDSENGTIAAESAGIRCVAIPNRMTASSDLSRAALHADSLTELHRMLGKITPQAR